MASYDSGKRFEVSVALTKTDSSGSTRNSTLATFSLERETAKDVVAQAIKMLQLIAAELA